MNNLVQCEKCSRWFIVENGDHRYTADQWPPESVEVGDDDTCVPLSNADRNLLEHYRRWHGLLFQGKDPDVVELLKAIERRDEAIIAFGADSQQASMAYSTMRGAYRKVRQKYE